MGISGQLHAPAALLQGKIPLAAIEWELGWMSEPVWGRFGEDTNVVELIYTNL
jgi:hypothetical protein